MAVDPLQLDQISKMILDQMNPTAAKDLVVRSSQLIDNPKAVYEEFLINAYSPNKFAGKTDFQFFQFYNKWCFRTRRKRKATTYVLYDSRVTRCSWKPLYQSSKRRPV